MITSIEPVGPELEARFRALLPHMNHEQVEALLDAVRPLELDSLEESQTGMVMLTALDAYQEPFHLGEVLVSVAEVTFDGLCGHATVMGDDTRRALLAALVSAASRHGEAESLLADFRETLVPISQSVDSALEQEATLVAATRVNFDSMAPEEP